MTFHFYLDFETNKLRGNATWIGPEMPEGKLIEYKYVLSSVVASTIVGGSISVEVCACAFIIVFNGRRSLFDPEVLHDSLYRSVFSPWVRGV